LRAFLIAPMAWVGPLASFGGAAFFGADGESSFPCASSRPVKEHAPKFRISRLSSFALLSAAVILLLGTVTARYLVHQIAERELQRATATAEWLARLGVQPRVDGADGRLRVSRGEARTLDRLLRDRSVVGPDVARIDVLDSGGAVRYSTDPTLIDAPAATQTMSRRASPC
jgi:hypothetical protein